MSRRLSPRPNWTVVGRLACFSVVGVLELPPVWRAALGGASQSTEGCAGECAICHRLRSALLEALAVHDPESLAVTDLETRAELPESALAMHYGTIDNCLVAAYDEVSRELYLVQLGAFAGPGDWHARFSGAVAAALEQIESTPGAAQLYFGELARGNPRIRARRAVARERVVRLLSDEYERERGEGLPDLHFEFLVGALYRAAQEELAAGGQPTCVAERVSELLAVLAPVPA